MRKQVFSMCLGLTMIISTTVGCEKASDATLSGLQTQIQSEAEAESEDYVEISFYTTDIGKDQMFQDIISDFENKNPGIKVEYIPGGDDQLQQWMALYVSNDGPTKYLGKSGKNA